jgi:hypothetical protein
LHEFRLKDDWYIPLFNLEFAKGLNVGARKLVAKQRESKPLKIKNPHKAKPCGGFKPT